VIEKVSVAPLGLVAVGWNEYPDPATAVVAGVPEMVGGGVDFDPVTVMENAGNEADAEPLLTLITMPEVVPTLVIAGVPLRLPVEASNVAHEGRLLTEKSMAPAPEGSEALG
jgi:hypothetical protein